MTLTRSFIRNAATTPLDARLMDMAKLVANADGSPRAGVIGGANPSIVSTTATMNVAIAAAEFATTKGKADGVAIFTNDGTVNVPIATAPASNSRIDVVYVKHNDDTTGDPNPNPIFGVAKGVAAASPVKPAIPTGALELATLRIYSGTTATNGGSNTLTNTYQMTATRGGVVPFRTKADLDQWTSAKRGQLAEVIGTDAIYARRESDWGVLGHDDSGWVSITDFTGWTPTEGDVPQVRRVGKYVTIRGRVALATGGGWAKLCGIPAGYRPARATLFGTSRAETDNVVATLMVATDGTLSSPEAFRTGALSAVGRSMPLVGGWFVD